MGISSSSELIQQTSLLPICTRPSFSPPSWLRLSPTMPLPTSLPRLTSLPLPTSLLMPTRSPATMSPPSTLTSTPWLTTTLVPTSMPERTGTDTPPLAHTLFTFPTAGSRLSPIPCPMLTADMLLMSSTPERPSTMMPILTSLLTSLHLLTSLPLLTSRLLPTSLHLHTSPPNSTDDYLFIY